MEKILFKEEQKFRQPWIWLLIIPISSSGAIFMGFGMVKQLIQSEPFGDNPVPDVALLIIGIFSILLMIGITMLFYTMKMVVEIRSSGIYFRYPPMINKFKKIGKEEIKHFEVREYKPIREYGGYGIKTGPTKFGRAYNVQGKIGLQLYLIDSRKVLFGTQRKDAIASAMTKLLTKDPFHKKNL